MIFMIKHVDVSLWELRSLPFENLHFLIFSLQQIEDECSESDEDVRKPQLVWLKLIQEKRLRARSCDTETLRVMKVKP